VESALESIDALAREELARWGVPGLAVGLLAEGRSDVGAWGVASLASGERVRPETTFRVASVTKPFTAELARAVLDLDEPLDTPAGPVAPRLLLAHVGGLRCEGSEPLDPFPTVSAAVEGAGLRAWGEPGRLWVYSNAGYWLVGAAVERATGTRFEEAMREHVLAPRGLAGPGFDAPSASGHEPVEPGATEHRAYPVPGYPVARRPSGGMVATVAELLGFAETFWDDVEARTVVARQPGGRQGVGWMVGRRGGVDLLFHPGSAAGFQSTLMVVPERRVAVAALSNSTRGRAAFEPVVDALLEAVAGVPRWEPRIVDASPEELASVAGRYADADADVVVEALPDALSVRLSDRDPFTGRMVEIPAIVGRPVGDGTFAVLEGEEAGAHFDFPDRFFRLGSMLAERVP
jgi:CubicO group peptidase (beta-lactamase class C family)